MKGPKLNRHLSGVDAAFLYLERKEIPLNIAAIFTFDGILPYDDFTACIDSKLHLIPRYRQVVAMHPYNLGPPTWEFDRNFDIRRHIFHTRVRAPGGEKQLEALVGRIVGEVMDRSKPLWDLHVVDGLKDDRGALIMRVHHALADGISVEALLNIIFSTTAESSWAIGKRRYRVPRHAPGGTSLVQAVGEAVHSTLENLLLAERGVLDMAETLLTGRMQNSLKALNPLLPELAASVERLPFNRPCGGDRRFCWAECNLADIKAVRALAGGTINDIILTIVTRALARYVRAHRQTVTGRFIRVVCPVSVRQEDHGDSLGNRISFIPVALPMDVADPLEMLKAVTIRTEIMKNSHAADLVGLIGACLATAPPALQTAFWSGITGITLPLPLFNIICTNVPASPVPLYTVGRRMLTLYPHVPTGYELGVGIAVTSYDGKLFFGLTADAHVAADVRRLRDFMLTAAQELYLAAGVKQPQRRRKPPKPGKPAKGAKRLSLVSPEPQGTESGTPVPNLAIGASA